MRTKLFLAIALCLMGTIAVSAQAFDGDADWKLGAGYLNVGGKSGAQVWLDYGLNDYLSLGMQYKVLILDDNESDNNFFNGCDMNIMCNYHWCDLLKLPSQFDIYTGAMLGVRNGGLMGGMRYNFSERVGIYAEAQQYLFRVFFDDDHNRIFKNKFCFSAGISINLR